MAGQHKRGPKVGSGGVRRRRLEGRGPTPRAEDREYHVAHARKKAREADAAKQAQREQARRGGKLPASLQIAEGFEVIAGRNPAVEAMRAGLPATRVFMAPGGASDDRIDEIIELASQRGAPVLEVTRGQLDTMTDKAVHQGVAVEAPPYEYVDLEDINAAVARRQAAADITEPGGAPGLIVALDSVTDPHNLGAVLRSGAAFGIDGVILPSRRSASVNATVWKVSAGAVAHIPVARVTNLTRALEELKAQGWFVVGLDGGGDTQIDQLELADVPLIVVLGAEGEGLSRLVRESCDSIASIPIRPTAESLNAAVAAGISLYQVDRLREAGRAAAKETL